MLKTNTEQVIKQGIITSVLNNSAYAKGQLEHLYELLLNDSDLARLKPFNFIRNLDSITEHTGLFRLWLVTKGAVQEHNDIYIAGKRIARATERMYKDYETALPDGLKGCNSIMIMLRVFFVPSSFALTATPEVRQTMAFVSYMLRTMLLLDLIFSSNADIKGYSPEYWLKQLISDANYDVDRLAVEIAQ